MVDQVVYRCFILFLYSREVVKKLIPPFKLEVNPSFLKELQKPSLTKLLKKSVKNLRNKQRFPRKKFDVVFVWTA